MKTTSCTSPGKKGNRNEGIQMRIVHLYVHACSPHAWSCVDMRANGHACECVVMHDAWSCVWMRGHAWCVVMRVHAWSCVFSQLRSGPFIAPEQGHNKKWFAEKCESQQTAKGQKEIRCQPPNMTSMAGIWVHKILKMQTKLKCVKPWQQKNGKKKAGHLFHPCCLCSLVFLGLRRAAANCLPKNNFKTCMGAGKLHKTKTRPVKKPWVLVE